jgi:hypothetical protein
MRDFAGDHTGPFLVRQPNPTVILPRGDSTRCHTDCSHHNVDVPVRQNYQYQALASLVLSVAEPFVSFTMSPSSSNRGGSYFVGTSEVCAVCSVVIAAFLPRAAHPVKHP